MKHLYIFKPPPLRVTFIPPSSWSAHNILMSELSPLSFILYVITCFENLERPGLGFCLVRLSNNV